METDKSFFKDLYNLFQKKDAIYDLGHKNLYMTQRWLSFHSEKFAKEVNNSTNKLGLAVKDLWYKLLYSTIPKSPTKKINYVKKEKDNKIEKYDREFLLILANNNEISIREVENYLNSGLLDNKKIDSLYKEYRKSIKNEN